MGRKRKTRWRRLSIGEISGGEEEDGDLAGTVASLTRSLSSSQNHSPARGHSDKQTHNSSTIMTKGSNSSTSLHNSSNSLSNGPSGGLSNGEMSSPKKHGTSTTTLVNGDTERSHRNNGDSGSTSSGQSSSGTAQNNPSGPGATNGYNGQGNYHHHNNHHYDSASSHYDRYHYHKDNYRPPSYYNNGSYDRSDRGGYHGGGHHHKEYHGGYQGYHSNYNYKNNYNNYRNNGHYSNGPAASNGSSSSANGTGAGAVTNGGGSGSEGYNGGGGAGGSDYQYQHPSRSYGAGRFRRSRSYPASNYYYANGSSHSGGAANNCDNTNKPSYNQDEYTKITTPRQDVLFKKGYLSQKKSSVDSTSTPTTPSASNNGTPDTQSTNGINSDYSEGYENGETDCVIPYDDAYYYGPPPPEAVFTDPNTGQVYYGHCSSSGEYYDAYPVSPMMVAGYPPTVYYPVPYPIDWNGVPAPMYPSVVALPPHPNGHQPSHLEELSLDPSHSLQLQGVELTPIDNQMAKSDTSAPGSEGDSPPPPSQSPARESPTDSFSCSETNSSVVEKDKDPQTESPPGPPSLPELVSTSSPSSTTSSSSDGEKSTVPNKKDSDNNNSSSKSGKKDKAAGVSLSTGGKGHSKKADLSSSSTSSSSTMSSASSTTSSAPVSPPGGTGSSIPTNPSPSSSISNQSSATTSTTTPANSTAAVTTTTTSKGHAPTVQTPHVLPSNNPGAVISTVQLTYPQPPPPHHNNNINSHPSHYSHPHNQAVVRHHPPPPQMNHHGPPPPLQSYPGIPPPHHQIPPPHPMALGGPPPQYHHMYAPPPHQPHPGPGFVYGPPVYNGVVVPIAPVAAASAAASSSSLSTIETDTVSSPPSSSRKKRKKRRREKGGHEHGDEDDEDNGQLTDEVSADSADEPTPTSTTPIPNSPTLPTLEPSVEVEASTELETTKTITSAESESILSSDLQPQSNPNKSTDPAQPEIKIMENLSIISRDNDLSRDNLQKPKPKEADNKKGKLILQSSTSSSSSPGSESQSSTETSSTESTPSKKSKKASRKNVLAKDTTTTPELPSDPKKSHKLSQGSSSPQPRSTMEMTVDGNGDANTENKNSNEAGSNPDGDSASQDASVDLSTPPPPPSELAVETPSSSEPDIKIERNQSLEAAGNTISSSTSSSKKPQDLKVQCPLDFADSDLSHLHLLQSPDFTTTTEPSSPDSLNTTQSMAGSEVAGVENLSVSESELLMMNRTTSIDEVEEDLPQEQPSESSVSFATPTEVFAPYESASSTPSISLCQPVSEVSAIPDGSSVEATKEPPTPVPYETKPRKSFYQNESLSNSREDESLSSPQLLNLDSSVQNEEGTMVQEPPEEGARLSELEQGPLTDLGHAESGRDSEPNCPKPVPVNSASSDPNSTKDDKERPRSITLAVSEWLKTQGDDALTPINPTAAAALSTSSEGDDMDGDAEDSDFDGDEDDEEHKTCEQDQKNGYGNPWVAPSNKSGSVSTGSNGIRGNLTKSSCRSGSMKEDCNRNINQKDGVVGSRVASQQSTGTNSKYSGRNDSNINQIDSKSTSNRSGAANYDSGLELSSPENAPEQNDQKTVTKEKKLRKSEERDFQFQGDKKSSERSSSLLSHSSSTSTNNNTSGSLDEKDHTEICDPQKFAKYYQFGVVFDTDHDDQGIETEEDSLEDITLTTTTEPKMEAVKDSNTNDSVQVTKMTRNKESAGTSVILRGYCDENDDEEIGTFDPKSLPKRFSSIPRPDPVNLKTRGIMNHLYVNPMSLARELVESSSSSGEPLSDSWDVDSEPLPDYESPPEVQIPVYNDLTPQGKVIRKNLQAVGLGDSVTSAICCSIT